MDLAALLDFHYSHDCIGTVTGVRPTSRYGEMAVEDGRVVEFNEKEESHGYVSGGFFVFQREFLDYLDDDPDLLFERRPLQTLAQEGELAVFPHHDFWMGMDTYREMTALNELWASGEAPWKVWTRLSTVPATGRGEEMHALATELYPITRSITGDGVRQTLARIGQEIELEVHEVPSGTPALDWTVPDEWNIREAYVAERATAGG